MLRWLQLLVAVPALAGPSPPGEPPHRTNFASYPAHGVEDCSVWVKAAPHALQSYACFGWAQLRPEWRDEATRRLEALAALRAPEPYALLYAGVGRLKWGRASEAEGLLRAAAQALAQRHERIGETYARLHLEFLLRRGGRVEEARSQRLQARVLAAELGDPILTAMVQIFEGWELREASDYGGALSTFEHARDVLARGPNAYLESLAWEGIAAAALSLGRLQLAKEAEERRIGALAREGAPTALARVALANRAFHLASAGLLPWSEVDRLVEEAQVEAVRARSSEAASRALFLHALRHGGTALGMAELEEVLRAARAQGRPYELSSTLWQLGLQRARQDVAGRPGAAALVDEAIEVARRHDHLDQLARALLARATLRWEAGDAAAARSDARAALSFHELERDRQFEESARIGVVAWSSLYVDLAQALIRQDDLPGAFAVGERMRARALLETVRRDAAARPEPLALAERGRQLRQRLTTLQGQLLAPDLAASARSALRAELERAEEEERDLADERARADAPRSSDAQASPVDLAEVQRGLAGDEALIVYTVAPTGFLDRGDPFEGERSWVLVITSDAARVVPIPGREGLAESVAMFWALLQRADGTEREGAVRLYRELLADALGPLEARTRRLVLVPDGPLHALPFETLRATEDAPVLAQRFTIVHAPSASLWARWRRSSMPEHRKPLLALADPSWNAASTAKLRQAAPWLDGLHLGTLPHSRKEVQRAVATMGKGSVALVGAEASEHALKQLPLHEWAALHLAAHAVMDDEVPGRSAVVLAPGASDEDGLLQMRDVAALDLRGLLVVLASCRSASGPVLGGEGPVGLSRAFLQAGARAVVVTLGELGDDASERLFSVFYARLVEGASVQEALRDAQVARAAAGASASDWAGLVVLGDGDLHLSGGGPEDGGVSPPIVVAAALALVWLVLGAARHRMARATPLA